MDELGKAGNINLPLSAGHNLSNSQPQDPGLGLGMLPADPAHKREARMAL